MQDISVIDSNLKVDTHINKSDIRFLDVKQPPFQIYGVSYENGKFRRFPESAAKAVSAGVLALHANTAGGRVRFQTDSPYIAIRAKMPAIRKMSHFALTGSAGFDLYVWDEGERYVKTFVPPFGIDEGYESVIEIDSSGMREYTINFPLYSEVSELYIGISNKALVSEPTPYVIERPVVYYGSSITQGGCASRPGNAYESIVSRRLKVNHINLGFSGNAKGEESMAEYIKNLEMTAFVYDYDYNAPSLAHLENTHERMFRIIRKANPDLPIVLMSRPAYYLSTEEQKRLEVIQATYTNAKENGDSNVYLIDGRTLMKMAGNEGTVDGCHPNDLGFSSMAKAVGDLLESILFPSGK